VGFGGSSVLYVSTLLEILAATTWGAASCGTTPLVSTLLEILVPVREGRLVAAGVVSTLLEILGGTRCRSTLFCGSSSFQPFLRFWRRLGGQEQEVCACRTVSTLLEILAVMLSAVDVLAVP